MSGEQNVVRLADARQAGAPGEGNARALQHAAARLAEFGRGGTPLRTRDLVGLLLSHGARTWRNSFPIADVRLRVFAPGGKAAIKIRLH